MRSVLFFSGFDFNSDEMRFVLQHCFTTCMHETAKFDPTYLPSRF